jgi:Ca2+-binding RTX toxin-like protein
VGGAVELPARLNGGQGDDGLRGGAGPDLAFGEDGDDLLIASRGRDGLDGGPGSNRLVVNRSMGEIQIGSSAAGDALRILATAYDLPPLGTDRDGAPLSVSEIGPIVVGAAELLDDDVVELLRSSYQAGHAIALTGAEATDAELLRDLLGHASGGSWDAEIPQADLIAFRRAIRPDGGVHESTSILLPRPEVELPPVEARRGAREADLLAVEALSRVFSGTPVLADTENVCTGVSPEQCLQTLADSYQSNVIVQNNNPMVLQITNSAWNARSFQNQLDLYYVFQEVDYTANTTFIFEQFPCPGPCWETVSDNLFGQPSLLGPPMLIEPSPQTTQETRSITSGVDQSYSGNIGYNATEGLNATLGVGVTVENSTTIDVPPVIVTFTETPDPFAEAKWTKEVGGFASATVATVSFYNQWIWEVPFDRYAAGQLNTAFLTEATFNSIADNGGELTATLHSQLPLPFGDTFALQAPVVTSVDPDDVCAGDKFTITGTGLYPTLVQAVLINGTALDTSAFSRVSDTEITVVAPDMLDTVGFFLPVAVATAEGLSNDDVTIAIDPLCAPAGGAPAPVRAQSAAVGTDP